MSDNAKINFDGDIYGLKLHEFISSVDTNSMILRVPGGWLYSHYHAAANTMVQTFVPYDNGFHS